MNLMKKWIEQGSYVLIETDYGQNCAETYLIRTVEELETLSLDRVKFIRSTRDIPAFRIFSTSSIKKIKEFAVHYLPLRLGIKTNKGYFYIAYDIDIGQIEEYIQDSLDEIIVFTEDIDLRFNYEYKEKLA